MTKVLITGGSGGLGSQLAPRFTQAGFDVLTISRHAPKNKTVPWMPADLATGAGVAEAMKGVDVVVHAASSPLKNTAEIDVQGTAHLLQQAHQAAVSHFLYVSIVGIDRIPLAYYQHKLAAEQQVKQSAVPWTIVRAAQFHTFVDLLLHKANQSPLFFLPTDFKFQPIDVGEVSDYLVGVAAKPPANQVFDVAGPQVITFGEAAKVWMDARKQQRRVWHLPLPGKVAAGYRAGYNTNLQKKYGRITWMEWVQMQYSGQHSILTTQ